MSFVPSYVVTYCTWLTLPLPVSPCLCMAAETWYHGQVICLRQPTFCCESLPTTPTSLPVSMRVALLPAPSPPRQYSAMQQKYTYYPPDYASLKFNVCLFPHRRSVVTWFLRKRGSVPWINQGLLYAHALKTSMLKKEGQPYQSVLSLSNHRLLPMRWCSWIVKPQLGNVRSPAWLCC